MNYKEGSRQGAVSTSEHSEFTLITPSTSPQPACTRCSGEEAHREMPHSASGDALDNSSARDPDIDPALSDHHDHDHSHAGCCHASSNVANVVPSKGNPLAQTEGLVQFLMTQNGQLAERLSKAEAILESKRDDADDNGPPADRPEPVAYNDEEDGCPWMTEELAAKERQQADESLQKEVRQLRDGFCRLILALDPCKVHPDSQNAMTALMHEFMSFPPDGTPAPLVGAQQFLDETFYYPASDKTTKRKETKIAMKDVREGLRIVMRFCTVICLLVAIFVLAKLPGQLGGFLRLKAQKQGGMGVWVHW